MKIKDVFYFLHCFISSVLLSIYESPPPRGKYNIRSTILNMEMSPLPFPTNSNRKQMPGAHGETMLLSNFCILFFRGLLINDVAPSPFSHLSLCGLNCWVVVIPGFYLWDEMKQIKVVMQLSCCIILQVVEHLALFASLIVGLRVGFSIK